LLKPQTGLTGLSALKLCYGNNISYTELDFLNLFSLRIILYNFRSYASIIIYFPSGVKPRTTASSRNPKSSISFQKASLTCFLKLSSLFYNVFLGFI